MEMQQKIGSKSILKRKLQLVDTYFSKQIFKTENAKLCENRELNESQSKARFNKDTCQTSIGNGEN